MRRGFLAGLAVLLIAEALFMPVNAAGFGESQNLRKVADLDLGWVSEIAFDGRWAYVYGTSLWIVDRKTKKVVGELSCPGINHYPGEVEVVDRGWVAIDKTDGCGAASDEVVFVDVRNPRRPIVRSSIGTANGNHTITAMPNAPYIYVSPNGCCGDASGGIERIIDARRRLHPQMVDYGSQGLGCHDVGFVALEEITLAACAAGIETQIWDVSDPAAPVTISRILTPYVFFNHSAAFSDDGRLLVVGDEAHGATTCAGTAPTGSLWFYDVSDPALPVLKGYYSNDHGSAVSSFWLTFDSWCTAHMYDFSDDSQLLATGWYQGGLNVLDLSDPTFPQETAFYISDDFFPWGAYWVGNEIWTADLKGWCGGLIGCGAGGGGGVEIFKTTN